MEGNTLNTVNALVLAIIPILSPILTDLFKKVVSQIPANYLPIVSGVIGALLAAVGDALNIPGLDGTNLVSGVALGLSGVGVREAWNQNVTKKLEANKGG